MDAQSGILGSFLPMIGGAPLEWALVLLLYAMIGGELLRRRPIAQAFAAMAVGVGISSGFARVLMGKWW